MLSKASVIIMREKNTIFDIYQQIEQNHKHPATVKRQI